MTTRRGEFVFVAAILLTAGCAGMKIVGMGGKAPEDLTRATVGAIRWDAWHGRQSPVGRAVEASLGPEQWHHRLPFFAKVFGDDNIEIDGAAQAVMDQELEYAHSAGLDYWAFVAYETNSPMSLGLQRYLASSRRSLVNFCLIAECGRWNQPAYVERLTRTVREPGYQTVPDGRPLVYIGFITPERLKAFPDGEKGFARIVSEFRKGVRAQGLPDPYLVVMDFNPAQGKAWADRFGFDALSTYATSPKGSDVPYSSLAAHARDFWEKCRATGCQVVPIVMAGWDRRPRVARPVPWETWQKSGEGIDQFCRTPKPAELAGHLADALNWMQTNAPSAQARTVILYAWNENDEGGWIVPTLSEGTARLDAIRECLKNYAPPLPTR